MTSNKPLLIIKTGNTVPQLREQGEDFEDWFIAGCGVGAADVVVVSVFLGEELPAPEDVSGVIITGSPAYVTDQEPWNFTAADFIKDAVAAEIPVLGVCYGHQLLAWAFAGEVGFHPAGREIGSVDITLSAAANDDLLFAGMPATLKTQVSHQQSVLSLPPGAVHLAGNEFEPNHAFRIGKFAWGIQFHPEFDARVTGAYLNARRDALVAEGLDVERLESELAQSPESTALLRRFAELSGFAVPPN